MILRKRRKFHMKNTKKLKNRLISHSKEENLLLFKEPINKQKMMMKMDLKSENESLIVILINI
jgi:hypothetical protein